MAKADPLTNPRAELALLGSVVRAKVEMRVQIVMRVREEWFSSADRAAVWQVMVDLVNRSLPMDITLLDDALKAKLPDASRLSVIEAITNAMPTASLWEQLADRVEDYHTRRRGIELCEAAKAQFSDLKIKATDALGSAESDLFSLHNMRASKGMQHIGAFMGEATDKIYQAISNRGYVNGGLPSGLTDLDRRFIGGARPGYVILFGAEPGGGKTVLLMELFSNLAMGEADYDEARVAREKGFENYQPQPVGIYSYEMDGPALAQRYIITRSKIQLNKMQRGQVSRQEQEALQKAYREILASKLHIEHCPGTSIQELRVKARYDVQRLGLKAIGIDYAQLITSSSKSAQGNRTQEMVDVSKGIDLMAEECGVPVFVLAQTKQEFWGKRGGIAALAETSQLAKDADLIGLLGFWDNLNSGKKNKGAAGDDSPWPDEEDGEQPEPGDPTVFAYLDIVKNRHGPNTQGQEPIRLLWERDYYEFISTTKRLYDSTGKEVEGASAN